MTYILKDVLSGHTENVHLPFLWQRAEEEAVIRLEIQKANEAHIGAICVESRPHPDFLGDTWWRDMDIIMDECQKRHMEVWLLDDAQFPTGYAAGRVSMAPDRLKKTFLREFRVDVVGPLVGASQIIPVKAPDKLLGVYAYPRSTQGEALCGAPIDLSENQFEDLIYWDIPEGFWRIFYLYETANGNEKSPEMDEYLNPLIAESTQILIDAVYESHYTRYGADFGKTFRGFFSDESQFGNVNGNMAAIGLVPNMPLPTCPDLLPLLNDALGFDALPFLAGLWYDIGERTYPLRYAYMDVVSKLYGDNFSDRIGDWCRDHGVKYIGHVIEDNGAHARLGNGTGHFFRALWGQDWSGIDIVLCQLLPGMKGNCHVRDTNQIIPENYGANWEFYHYALAKLGASLGHLDPKKQGVTMCEIFGAFGWVEGLSQMKWLADFMLVHGINRFVPHAFSSRFPDPDGPPHFYVGGENPQYRYFHRLMDYMTRIASLTSEGKHHASAAVLYHGEGEWGSEKFMPLERPVRLLSEVQIDSDIVSLDMLLDKANSIGKSGLCIQKETFQILVVPYAQRIPYDLALWIERASELGFCVIFLGGLPDAYSTTEKNQTPISRLLEKARVTEEETLPSMAKSLCISDFYLDRFCPALRFYHYEKQAEHYYMLFNDGSTPITNIKLSFAQDSLPVLYDAYENKVYEIEKLKNENGTCSFTTDIEGYAAIVVCFGGQVRGAPLPLFPKTTEGLILPNQWTISTATAKDYPTFTPCPHTELGAFNARELYPHFVGTICYTQSYTPPVDMCCTWIDLGKAGETVQLWVDEKEVGLKIAGPYRFYLGDIKANVALTIRIEVTTTLVYKIHDNYSIYQSIPPAGLLGPVILLSN